MDVQQRINDAIMGISAQALADGVISKEESHMIEQIEEDLLTLAQKMVSYERDRMIDVEEFREFKRIKSVILENAWKLAEMDDKITTDEEGILGSLFHLLDELELKKE